MFFQHLPLGSLKTQKPAFRQVWVGEKWRFWWVNPPLWANFVSAEGLEPSTNGLKGRNLKTRFSQPMDCPF